MLSRVAETVYWTGRYVERAENTARLVQAYSRLQYALPRGRFPGWEPLLRITNSKEAFLDLHKAPGERSVCRFLLTQEDNPGSALASLASARENMRTVRDIMPQAAWEQLNAFALEARARAREGWTRSRQNRLLDLLILGCQTHVGVLTGTLSRDAVYQFLLLGRRLERADMVSRLLDMQSEAWEAEKDAAGDEGRAFREARWRAVLDSVSGLHMYRLRVQAGIEDAEVLRFLLRDANFPRSIGRCLTAMEAPLKRLPRAASIVRAAREARKRVAAARPSRLGGRELTGLMDRLQVAFADLHARIDRAYFHPEGQP